MADRTTAFGVHWESNIDKVSLLSIGTTNIVDIKPKNYHYVLGWQYDTYKLVIGGKLLQSITIRFTSPNNTIYANKLYCSIAAYHNDERVGYIQNRVVEDRDGNLICSLNMKELVKVDDVVVQFHLYNADKELAFEDISLDYNQSITMEANSINQAEIGDVIRFGWEDRYSVESSPTTPNNDNTQGTNSTTIITGDGDEIILEEIVVEGDVVSEEPAGLFYAIPLTQDSINGDIIKLFDAVVYNTSTNTLINTENNYKYTGLYLYVIKQPDATLNILDVISNTVEDEWDETIIRNAILVQEMDRFSSKLSVNTLTFDIVDAYNRFNFGNSKGNQNYIKKGQILYPYEYIEGTKIELGKFYISDIGWDNNIAKFTATSYLGMLDKVDFNDSGVYSGTKASTVIRSILGKGGIHSDEFTISEEIANKELYGTIKPCTCRQALQQVLFATHAVIDSTQDNKINIISPSNMILSPIPRSAKFSTRVDKADYITGVELRCSLYNLEATQSEIYKDTKEPGDYTIMLDRPVSPSTISISGASELRKNAHYVIFRVLTRGEVVIKGKYYNENVLSIYKERPIIDTDESEKIEKFTTTLCDEATANALCDELFDYYTQATLQVEVKHLATENSMNNMRYIENTVKHMNKYYGAFTKRTFDLTGGFIDTATLIGYLDTQDYDYYATSGNNIEMYANDNFLI